MSEPVSCIVTQARSVQVDACSCPAGRFPSLKRMGGKSLLVRYVCHACGKKGVNGINAETAARKWNEGQRQ